MAMSSVARTMARFLFLSIALLLGLAADTSAQTVAATNSTTPLRASGIQLELQLTDLRGVPHPDIIVLPLTESAGMNVEFKDLRTWNIPGVLRHIDSSSANNVNSDEIAFISCDPNGSNIQSSDIVASAMARVPKAILLYSTNTSACSISGSFVFPSVYTMTKTGDTRYLSMTLGMMGTNPLNARIVANTTQIPTPSGNNNDGGPAPTTAVAMSILYSITGIITLLFLVIITTGAMRAHRNPARYGPRRAIGGRPRQSRAKGLARAMLETLPIVKFGDPEPAKPGADVELEDGKHTVHNSPAVAATTEDTQVSPKATEETPKPSGNAAALESGMGPATQAESVNSGEAPVPKDGELGCSICTEDFTAGEDVRVLPCNHKFHPACVDPWLLNVSGTCPLCRHDLNPTATEVEGGDLANSNATGLAPPLEGQAEAVEDVAHPGRSRVSHFLDLRRLRTAPPDERIAALRQLREQSRANGEPAEDIEEPGRRLRVTNRLRGAFRTRRREESTSTPQTNAPTNPQVNETPP